MLWVVVLVLAACGEGGSSVAPNPDDTSPSVGFTPPGTSESTQTGGGGDGDTAVFGLRTCDDLVMIAAAPDMYRDHPIYVGNEMPVEEVAAWAATQPAFEELWIDRERNGWITVAFSSEADARQTDIDQLFPEAGVVAVAVDYTMDQLLALQQRVMSELPAGEWRMSSGVQPQHGVVTVGIGVLSDERLATVAQRFGDDPICVEGADPASIIAEGPQPEGGDGWRLLVDVVGGPPYRTGIAASQAEFDQLLGDLSLDHEQPLVDFDTEVVIWFGAVFSGSCPNIRLDDVVVVSDQSLVYANIVAPGPPPAACTADANGRTYLIAVERSRLPEAPFHIQLGVRDPPRGAPEERTVVAVDLRAPGTPLRPGDTGPDPALPGPPELDFLEPGFPITYSFNLHCGIRELGMFNGYYWHTEGATDTDNSIPPEWASNPDDTIDVELVLMEGPDPTITATYQDHSVVYYPSATLFGCD